MGYGHEAVARLTSRWTSLEGQWSHLRTGWRDSAANQFELSHWREFEEATPLYLARLQQALDLLDDALASNPVD